MSFTFSPMRPRIWTGRYARIPGETTAFHVRYRRGRWWPVIEWKMGYDVGECAMVNDGDADQLAAAVHEGKLELGGSEGGSFLINEFGQVLVPAPSGNGSVVLVGECEGPLVFEDPFHGGTFDLSDASGMGTGDCWDRPYLGVPHHLSRYGQIYFWNQDSTGGWKVTPPTQDRDLIDSLRALRPYGAVRFVVGLGGLVLTKQEVRGVADERWEPRFVRRLDYQHWYVKEDGHA